MEHAHDADVGCDAISIARCRELLGDEAVGLSDDEIDQIRRHAETMAQVLIEVFLDDRSRVR
jgi:hypothetical protein